MALLALAVRPCYTKPTIGAGFWIEQRGGAADRDRRLIPATRPKPNRQPAAVALTRTLVMRYTRYRSWPGAEPEHRKNVHGVASHYALIHVRGSRRAAGVVTHQ